MLSLYRSALRIRRAEGALNDGSFAWIPSDPNVLAFGRGTDVVSITNLSGSAMPLPPHRAVLLASADVSDGLLPPDATVWLRPDRDEPTDSARRVPDDDR
jgi:alpha-glucosidase